MRRFVGQLLIALALISASIGSPVAGAAGDVGRIKNLIVIYQENHAFDSYFANFPGADGFLNTPSSVVPQVDKQGRVYPTLPPVLLDPVEGKRNPDPRLPADLPNRPFRYNQFVRPGDKVPSQIHAYYRQQYQINGGRMDRFVAGTDGGGATMGYWDASALPLWQLAREYTLADRFFHAAFGGSFLNHQWLICACTPVFPNAPPEIVSIPFPDEPGLMQDRNVTPDGFVVNTSYTVNNPHPASTPANQLVPNQTAPTIGDRLNGAGVTWAWYSGGWNDAVAGKAPSGWSFHHQPFAFFANYADGTALKARHLKDEVDFLAALKDGTLPAVSFVKPSYVDNEHPANSNVERGQNHMLALVRAVQASRYWADAAIVITYDENGGYWDHVAPPVVDKWGPGLRVPTVVVSPFARKGFVDHTVYDTTSILKLIETRWNVAPLGARDAAANDLTNAFDFAAAQVRTGATQLPRTGGPTLELLLPLAALLTGLGLVLRRR